MSLVLSSIFIFLIVLPGIVARFSYYTYPFSNSARDIDIIKEITWALVPGLFLQFFAVLIVENLTDVRINFKYIGQLLVGNDNSETINIIFQNIKDNLSKIIVYNLLLLAVSFTAGILFKEFIRKFKLDRKIEFLRFNNKWFYILSGEVLDFPDVPDSYEDIDMIVIDAVCQLDNEAYIYMGELYRYYLTNNGGLEAILLRYPFRRKMCDDNHTGSSKYYEIPGKFLYLPYSEIKNINVRYIKVDIDAQTSQLQTS